MNFEYAQLLDQAVAAWRAFVATPAGQVSLFLAITAAIFWMLRGNSVVVRMWKAIETTMFSSWQLTLLGLTGLILSLASGWTTWDGMRNFTGEPILSLMVTFGIQGVMLIVAWLIGESFATGMNRRIDGQPGHGTTRAWGGALIGTALVLAGSAWFLDLSGGGSLSAAPLPQRAMEFAIGAIFLAAIVGLIVLNRSSDLAKPYVQSVRIVVRNAVLWVMFLACMATSVFFSFDSLFSSIFPAEERVRAADLRAQNQVAGIISDIDSTIERRRVSATDELFASAPWTAYDEQLTRLSEVAQASTYEIEKFFNDKIEARNRAIKEQQERVATSESTQAGIASRKRTMVEELTRLKGERGTLAADYTEKKTELEARARGVDAKRIEAMAEEKGAEGTLKQGRGPIYRQIMSELAQLQAAYKIQDDRVRDAERRLAATDSRIAQIERELASVDGDLAKLKGEAQTAEQRIQLLQVQNPGDLVNRVDPARVLPAFETARAEFRQSPDADGLMKLQQQCTQVVNAMLSNDVTKPRVRDVDCDPKQAAEAAAPVFALNVGRDVFGQTCRGGDKLNSIQGADALFGFARKCLADSGLPSRETDQLRTRINFIELNRDDKAHRFVVTWNAFQDGNRLAYLALAIAIAIDSLVFMSGLFGANALRSPLSDVPSSKARSARQLEAIIDTALIPHEFETARLVLGSMRPITLNDGFMARVVIGENDPHASDVLRVLNAGASIDAVRSVGPNTYEVRAELFEYLSQVAKRKFEANSEHVNLAELERTVSVALLPEIGANAGLVLSFMHPTREDRGFMAEVRMSEVSASATDAGTEDDRIVRSALNAGAIYQRVQPVAGTPGVFWVHGDFYKVLARLRGRMLNTSSPRVAIAQAAPRVAIVGGRIDAKPSPVADETPRAPRLSDQTERLQTSDTKLAAEWERHCWDVLLESLRLGSGSLARLRGTNVSEASAAAWNYLRRLSERSDLLRHLLVEHQKLQEQHISDAYSRLRGEANGQPELVDILDKADHFINSHLSSLMLFPENGLIDYVVEEIDHAAGVGELRGDEEQLRGILVSFGEQLGRSDLGQSESWANATEVLRRMVNDQNDIIGRLSPRQQDQGQDRNRGEG